MTVSPVSAFCSYGWGHVLVAPPRRREQLLILMWSWLLAAEGQWLLRLLPLLRLSQLSLLLHLTANLGVRGHL